MNDCTDMQGDEISFVAEDAEGAAALEAWRILIVDDDQEVHVATKLALRGLDILGRPLALLDAYSAHECIEMLRQQDVAVVLLDVVMESESAGIKAVGIIRNELGLTSTRIILRTGQPGYAPAIDTIRLYDINDYTLKTELNRTKLYSALTAAVRSYAQICRLEAGQCGLQRLVAASNALIAVPSMQAFMHNLIGESAVFLQLAPEGMVCSRDAEGAVMVRAATGPWADCVGKPLTTVAACRPGASIARALAQRGHVFASDQVVLFFAGRHGGDFVVSLAAGKPQCDIDTRLLENFCTHVAVCADNVNLIEERTNALDLAREQLVQSEKMASIGQLAAGVAHEINNPIGYVYSNLGALQHYADEMFELLDAYDKLASAEQKAALQELLRTVDVDYLKADIPSLLQESREGIGRVRKIVQDLKEFSHVDSGQDWQWVDLHQGLDSVLNLLAKEITSKADVVKAYGVLPEVECLPAQLNQVFMNLLLNAAQSMGAERGRITLRSGANDGEVWLEFVDNGCGIAKEIRQKIFDPFFTTKPVGVGTGLGLSVSYGIVAKHGGAIDVSSEVGKGSTFRVVLPVRRATGGAAQ